jgi:ankyrin repeat protein
MTLQRNSTTITKNSHADNGKLMLAAYHGHADLVKVLIQHGADPNRLNDRGQSPLAGAVFKKEDAVIQVS